MPRKRYTPEEIVATAAVISRGEANLRLAREFGFVGTPRVVVDGVPLSLQRGWTMQQVECLVGAARTNVRSRRTLPTTP